MLNFYIISTIECDQRVLSRKESWAYITSPNYPDNYRHNTSCFYFIDGMEDRQNLEKAKLTILYIDIPPFNEKLVWLAELPSFYWPLLI